MFVLAGENDLGYCLCRCFFACLRSAVCSSGLVLKPKARLNERAAVGSQAMVIVGNALVARKRGKSPSAALCRSARSIESRVSDPREEEAGGRTKGAFVGSFERPPPRDPSRVFAGAQLSCGGI